ncbi:MAG: hypothetical protein AAGB00_03770 [Planctomycetota bacterium]
MGSLAIALAWSASPMCVYFIVIGTDLDDQQWAAQRPLLVVLVDGSSDATLTPG